MIDREQVRHVAHLGRLQLTEAEEISFTRFWNWSFFATKSVSELSSIMEAKLSFTSTATKPSAVTS